MGYPKNVPKAEIARLANWDTPLQTVQENPDWYDQITTRFSNRQKQRFLTLTLKQMRRARLVTESFHHYLNTLTYRDKERFVNHRYFTVQFTAAQQPAFSREQRIRALRAERPNNRPAKSRRPLQYIDSAAISKLKDLEPFTETELHHLAGGWNSALTFWLTDSSMFVYQQQQLLPAVLGTVLKTWWTPEPDPYSWGGRDRRHREQGATWLADSYRYSDLYFSKPDNPRYWSPHTGDSVVKELQFAWGTATPEERVVLTVDKIVERLTQLNPDTATEVSKELLWNLQHQTDQQTLDLLAATLATQLTRTPNPATGRRNLTVMANTLTAVGNAGAPFKEVFQKHLNNLTHHYVGPETLKEVSSAGMCPPEGCDCVCSGMDTVELLNNVNVATAALLCPKMVNTNVTKNWGPHHRNILLNIPDQWVQYTLPQLMALL